MKFGLNLQSIFSETAEFKGLGRSFVCVTQKEAVSFWEYFISNKPWFILQNHTLLLVSKISEAQ